MYSQNDYPDTKLGTGDSTIAKSGCYLTSICNLASLNGVQIDPPTLNQKLIDQGGYANGDEMISNVAASLVGATYELSHDTQPSFACIAETDSNANIGIPQHFFVLLPDGQIIDPLDHDPQPKANNYHIVSYRIFNFPPMSPDNLNRTISCLGAVYNKLADGSGTETPEQTEVTACAGLLRDIRSTLGLS